MKKHSFKWGAILLSPLLFLFLQACQDDEMLEVDETVKAATEEEIAKPEDETLSRKKQILDSIFLYAKEVYLWNDELPEYEEFNPHSYSRYSNDLDSFEEALFDLTQYAVNPLTGKPYEFLPSSRNHAKFSYIEESENSFDAQSLKSSTSLDGTEEGFGFGLSSVAANDIRVRYVDSGSPADQAGISRGDILLKVNGREVRADSKADIGLINGMFDKTQFPLTVQKPDGSVIKSTLIKTSYTVDPVYKSKVIQTNTKKVGYLAYSMFSSQSNSQAALENAFSEFASAGVSDLVVDLRYNGGGYVSTAEYLCNLIAPSSLNGSVMYTELYNEVMQNGEATILENQVLYDQNDEPVMYRGKEATYADLDFSEEGNTQKFRKKGSLGSVKNVYFIISGKTASASELVINSLKPYLNVTVIGSTSYGKPVGFFGIRIDGYTVYMSNFKTINSTGEGEYFAGLEPDVAAADDVKHDFGDPEELSLAAALDLIEQGSQAPNARSAHKSGRASAALNLELKHLGGSDGFQGMIEERRRLKP